MDWISYYRLRVENEVLKRIGKNKIVEDAGIEPATLCMLSTRSTNWAKPPFVLIPLSVYGPCQHYKLQPLRKLSRPMFLSSQTTQPITHPTPPWHSIFIILATFLTSWHILSSFCFLYNRQQKLRGRLSNDV